MSYALFVPHALLIVAAVLFLIFWKNVRAQEVVSFVFSSVLLVFAGFILYKVKSQGIQVLQVGSWPAPYGITLVADLTSALLLLTSSIVYWSINIYSFYFLDQQRKQRGYYFYANLILLGAIGVFLTGDLFNLYVSFELLLISSFALLTLGQSREEIRQAIPYVAMNLLSSLAFLVGIGLIYGHSGNLNIAYLSSLLRNSEWTYGIRTASVFLFFAFALKSSMFPLFFWLPRSYAAVPAGIAALFSCLLTKAGVYSFLRIFSYIFPIVRDPTLQQIFYYCALLTMVVGVVGALAQSTFKRILTVHIMSQVGYMLWGFCLFSPLALAGTLFFIVHNMIVKVILFMVSGIVEKHKLLTFVFFLSALSLAGLPPLSGFFAKLFLLKAGVDFEDWLGVGVAMLVSLMTLLSMNKIWNEVFFKEKTQKEIHSNKTLPLKSLFPVLFLSVVSLLIAFYSRSVFDLFMQAGETLFHPLDYREAVLGEDV
jgi:multicomponent Na+:H+ antiporter subunit D